MSLFSLRLTQLLQLIPIETIFRSDYAEVKGTNQRLFTVDPKQRWRISPFILLLADVLLSSGESEMRHKVLATQIKRKISFLDSVPKMQKITLDLNFDWNNLARKVQTWIFAEWRTFRKGNSGIWKTEELVMMERVKSDCLLKPNLKSKLQSHSPCYLSCQFGYWKDPSFVLKSSVAKKKDYNGNIKILIMNNLLGRLI